MLQRNKGYNHVLAGGSAAIMKTIVGQPFDVITTNMIGKNEGKGLISVCTRIFRNEGFFRGFWKGTVPSFCWIIPHATTFYYFLHYFRKNIPSDRYLMNNKPVRNFVIGGAARSIAVFVSTPLLLVKTHFEYNMSKDRNVMKTISQIFETGGVRGLFRGLNSSIIRNVPYGGLFFAIYRFMLSRTRFKTKSMNVFCSSVVASISSHYILHPFGVVRTRIQLQEKSVGTIRGLKNIYLENGISQLWRGTIPKVAKKAIASSMGWTVYNILFKD